MKARPQKEVGEWNNQIMDDWKGIIVYLQLEKGGGR